MPLHSLDRRWDEGRPLVLIIEPDQTARQLYSDWFFAEGFAVMSPVGIEGLAGALRLERPSLIVTEMQARNIDAHSIGRVASV